MREEEPKKQLIHDVERTLDNTNSTIDHMGINDILRCKNRSELEALSNNGNVPKVQDKQNNFFLDTAIQQNQN